MQDNPFQMPERLARIRLTGSGHFLPRGLPKAHRLLKALYPFDTGCGIHVPRPRRVPPSLPGGYPDAGVL